MLEYLYKAQDMWGSRRKLKAPLKLSTAKAWTLVYPSTVWSESCHWRLTAPNDFWGCLLPPAPAWVSVSPLC